MVNALVVGLNAVAPRTGRVSRNVITVLGDTKLKVAPRTGRVSRNSLAVVYRYDGTESRPARGV